MNRLGFAGVGVVLAVLALGTGCSSKDKKDTTPDPFTFTDQADVALNDPVESNEITVAGIDSSTQARVSGAVGAELSINGGAFSAAGGSVNAGDRIVVQVPASASFSTAVDVTLNIGGVTDVFSVTTLAADIQPDPVEVATKADVGFNAWQESDVITITGVNADTPISVANGEFKIDDQEFQSESATVTEGSQVTVRVMSPIKAAQSAVAILSLGEEPNIETVEFSVTTGPDTTAPEVAIHFPTPYTMTEGDSVFVRGTAKDVHGSLASVSVNGEAAELGEADEEGNVPWTVTVPLTLGNTPEAITENTLSVTGLDTEGNSNEDMAIMVRRDPEAGAFPDNENPTQAIGYSGDLVERDGGLYFYVPDAFGNKVISISLETSAREVFWESGSTDSFETLYSVEFDANYNAYVVGNRAVYLVSGVDQAQSVLLDSSNDVFTRPERGILDKSREDGGLYLADGYRVYILELPSYTVEILTDGSNENSLIGDGPVFDTTIRGIEFSDVDPDSMYVVTESSLFTLNLSNGAREKIEGGFDAERISDIEAINGSLIFTDTRADTLNRFTVDSGELNVISSNTHPNSLAIFDGPFGLKCMPQQEVCFVVDSNENAVFLVDVTSGHRVVLTKSIFN